MFIVTLFMSSGYIAILVKCMIYDKRINAAVNKKNLFSIDLLLQLCKIIVLLKIKFRSNVLIEF